MTRLPWCLPVALTLALVTPLRADRALVKEAVAREVVGPRRSLLDLQDHVEARLPRLPAFKDSAGWEKYATKLRADFLDRVVFRGEVARGWRDAKTQVVWLEELAGGPGYKVRKVRYEALPGLWIPAVLYEPTGLTGKVPVYLAVNGHDRIGKAATYKQIRCINLAKRGLIVLNVEWLNMGQLHGVGYDHYRMNQLDLCGASGLAPFYLSMSRGLDLLLAHPHADPKRVAVSGLSGGGWQTIFISSLDPRVTLANPVAGYSSFRIRLRDHYKDLGDSEQTPCDMATLADYTHLTALRAPRPTLLTYNAKDECCFEAGYALPPLLAAARPVYKLFGQEKALRSHVNHVPGTHNYERENREQFYRMVGDFFYPGEKKYSPVELPCDKELKSAAELAVKMPGRNADFNTLALGLAKSLPRNAALPAEEKEARAWQQARRKDLRRVVKARRLLYEATPAGKLERAGTAARFWKLALGGRWHVPVVELTRGKVKGTTILLNDAGRRADVENVERLLSAGQRVLAVDPFYFGEGRVLEHDFLFALLLSAAGDRPLGVQANEVAAVARFARDEYKSGPVTVSAVGPRLSLAALVAAALEEEAIGGLELHGAWGSLKEVLEQNRAVNQMPEVFCFGLLEAVDVKQLVALVAPRPVVLREPSDRAKAELDDLKRWYRLLGREHDPAR
jgi:hypothetical protein